jgi:hypothetical protein
VANNLARFWRWTKSLVDATNRRKQTEITIETDQVVIIRRKRSVRGWCHECGREVEIVRLEDAAAIAGMNGPLLHDGVARPWHFSDNGEKWVCLESLFPREHRSGSKTGTEEL